MPRSASAHHLWLEARRKGAKLYFGEFDENLREASPGLLDRFKPLPEAKVVGASGAQPLKVESRQPVRADRHDRRRGQHRRGAGERHRAQAGRAGGAHPGSPCGALVPDFAERAPVLMLDIVPTGTPGVFKVTYDGKPLPKAKAELIAESG